MMSELKYALMAVFVVFSLLIGFSVFFGANAGELTTTTTSMTTSSISEDAQKIQELAHWVALHKRIDENLTYVCHHFARDLVALLHEYNYGAVYVLGRYDCNYTSTLSANHAWVWAQDINQSIEAQSGEFLDAYNYAMCYHEIPPE